MVGWTDLPADLGDWAALARVAAYLPADAPVISSTLARAIQTADAIAGNRRRLPPDPDLREMHFGAWEMRAHDDIERDEPERIRAFHEHPGDVRPSGGESWNDLVARVDAAADRLAQAGGDVIVAAHFGPILTQVQRAMGLTADEAFAHRIDNLSVTRIDLQDGTWRVATINHLA